MISKNGYSKRQYQVTFEETETVYGSVHITLIVGV